MLEAKLGVDKAKTMLEQLDREVNQARREVEDTNDEKISFTREVKSDYIFKHIPISALLFCIHVICT